MRSLHTKNGRSVPVLGQGTWKMGADPARRREEADVLRLGLDLGLAVIDTAEMYADGGSEEVVGDALEGRREETYLVTKVLPGNASYGGVKSACERSLRRLRTDRIDLYLLHWPGDHPLEETVRAFTDLMDAGKILAWGVSNFDLEEMDDLLELPGGDAVASNQILYNLEQRGAEHSLLPALAAEDVFVMAYSPVGEGRLRESKALRTVADRHGVSPYAAAIAWTIRDPGVMSIPKAARADHLRENALAADLQLTEEDRKILDEAYPPPTGKTPLATA